MRIENSVVLTETTKNKKCHIVGAVGVDLPSNNWCLPL